jgi:A/G-specific adenine glycosylase
LATLPGIGRSTAAAIAAFCFGERVAILDGNVKRVLTRALGFTGDLAQARQERVLWGLAEAELPQGAGIESYTQGLMDLGATVCTTRQPRCLLCPLATRCVARKAGQPEAYPVKTRKLKRSARAHALLWLQAGGAVWLVQRPPTGVWAGLWSLPEFDSVEALQNWWQDVGDALSPDLSVNVQVLPGIAHVLTHFDWQLSPVRVRLLALGAAGGQLLARKWPQGRWVALSDLAEMGLAAPVRKLLVGG